MKSGMISMVLFQMRFAFRWDITSLAYRIPYSLIVYLFWVHLITFIPSMTELYCFSLDQGPCFAGFLEYSLTNALLVTFRHFRILNIALAKPVTTPRKNFQRFPYVEQQEKRRSNSECWDALLCQEGNMTFWDFFHFLVGKLISVKADKYLRFNLTILPYWVYSDILIRIWFNNLPKPKS